MQECTMSDSSDKFIYKLNKLQIRILQSEGPLHIMKKSIIWETNAIFTFSTWEK
jgi:hypothetical protein